MAPGGMVDGTANVTDRNHWKYPGQKKLFFGIFIDLRAPINEQGNEYEVAVGVKWFHWKPTVNGFEINRSGIVRKFQEKHRKRPDPNIVN